MSDKKRKLPAKPKSKVKSTITTYAWHDEIYSADHVVVVCSREDFEGFCRKHYPDKLAAFASQHVFGCAFATDNGSGCVTVQYWFLPEVFKGDATNIVQLIVHEAFHGVQMVMASRHVPLCRKTTEPWAFYLDTVVGALVRMTSQASKGASKC